MAKKRTKEEKNTEDVKKNENIAKKEKSKKSGSITYLIITSLTVIKIAVTAYFVITKYVELARVPDMPELDLNEWWGPSTTTNQDTAIRPFRVLFTEAMQAQMEKKFNFYRSVTNRKKSLNESWTYGINSGALGQILAHWMFKYETRERVRFLNQFNHFKTNIQGLDIHFLHVKPNVDSNVKVVPLLLLHGWPGSIREFYEAIPLLTTVRPGYDFVFEVIVPSLPGFVYSQAPIRPGLSPAKIAVVMKNLMQRLGFKQYYVQGGDFGHSIGSHIATLFPGEVLGFHTNFPVNFSELAIYTEIFGHLLSYVTCEKCLKTYVEQDRPFKERLEFILEESGYMHLQGTKPDTLGIALNDSPVGLAAYIIDKFMVFTDPENKFLEDGGLSKYFSLDSLLDNVMLYWSTGSITSSIRLYKESFQEHDLEHTLARIPSPVPTWALRSKNELVHQSDYVLRWKYPILVNTTNLDIGGHFVAFEKPEAFADDVFLAVSKFFNYRW